MRSNSANDAGPAGDSGDLGFAEDARPPRLHANAILPPPDFLVAPILRALAASGLSDIATMSEMRYVTFAATSLLLP